MRSQVAAPTLSNIAEVLHAFRSGKVAQVPGHVLFNRSLMDLNLDKLIKEHGEEAL